MDSYVRSLADPFDTSIQQPKFLDGRLDRTAGLRLRSTGTFSCNTAGYTYLVLHPGYSNVISWSDNDPGIPGTALVTNGSGTTANAPAPYSGFMANATEVASINRSRLVSAGVRFQLLNAPDESDGIWESVRINNGNLYSVIADTTSRLAFSNPSPFPVMLSDMPNNPTYQTGRLRDIARYLFRLNYRNAELTFTAPPVVPVAASAVVPSPSPHDMVVIRFRGRQISGQPSMLMYDAVACQEVEYVEGTALNRLMTYNTVVPNIDELANRLNFKTPALRAE